MYNTKVATISISGDTKLMEVEALPDGSRMIILKGKGVPLHLRRARMYTLAQFRDIFIPDSGLWATYFHCNKCEWERRNPKIAVCIYCDIPMTEINCPAFFKREVDGVAVLQVRTDIQEAIDYEVETRERIKNKDLIRKEGDINIIRIDVD